MVLRINDKTTAKMALNAFKEESRDFRFVLREIVQNTLDYGKSGIINITKTQINIYQASGDFNELKRQVEIAKTKPEDGKGYGLKGILDHGYDIICSKINNRINIKLIKKDSKN